MAYKLTFKKSPNFWEGRTQNISAIAIHWWGDPATKPSLAGVVNVLSQPSRQASAHYVASGTNREVVQLVREQDTSWATNSANPFTISIECDPRTRDSDYDVVAELIADIWKRHGKLPLVPHNKYSATQCPGNYSLTRLKAEAEAKFAPKESPRKVAVKYSRIKQKKVKMNKNAELWDFNHELWKDMVGLKTFKTGEILTVVGIAEHPTGSRYYMTSYSFAQADVTGRPKATNGINVADVTDYIPPKATAPKPTPTDTTNQDEVAGGDRATLEEIFADAEAKVEEVNERSKVTEEIVLENNSLLKAILNFLKGIFR